MGYLCKNPFRKQQWVNISILKYVQRKFIYLHTLIQIVIIFSDWKTQAKQQVLYGGLKIRTIVQYGNAG